jgi:mRNA interferase MazF
VAVKRGDIVLVALPGDFGKPRPAVVVQSDIFNDEPTSVIVCPLTTEAVDAPLIRISVEPTAATGLRQPSQIMIDKIVSVRPQRLRDSIGSVGGEILRRVDRALLIMLGLA